MPQQVITSVENNFTKGLITEATGLNFPENAATETDNCEYTLIGDVARRLGIDYEVNHKSNVVSRSNGAVSSYKWNNVGGDGLTQIVVEQIAGTLYFYRSSTATTASPLSAQLLISTVSVSSFCVVGNMFDTSIECTYADGNGYLFVYHPQCDPFFVQYSAGTLTASVIALQIRDFIGVTEPGVPVNIRPSSLTNEHLYNITNQGWTQANQWSGTTGDSFIPATGSKSFTTQSGLSVTVGDFVYITNLSPIAPGGLPIVPAGTILASGSVTAYSGTTITINVVSFSSVLGGGGTAGGLAITPVNHGYINTWFASESNYPSNADVWWYFKDTTGAFNPTVTQPSVSLNTGRAPQGHYIFNPFNQDRSLLLGVSGLTVVATLVRPTNGAFFAGRIFYTGVNAQQIASGDADYYTWTESIYFSQIIQTPADFGSCYQTNDPTSENLFDLLPTDGGVIVIQGSGTIYKLFPIQNGMLCFAANGVWFLTGSQGIGFSASDYTITKISSVRCISNTSFVNVNGLPYFWNEEGIYSVEPTQGGGLAVNPITVGTILTYYNNIPRASLTYVRGDYDPIGYVIQWVFKSTVETSVNDRYTFDTILNFNTYNKAFFPYTVDTSTNSINGIVYVSDPGGVTSPDASLKYLASSVTTVSFADEHDLAYVDWGSINYSSYFVTGYKLRGQAIKKFQPQYIQIYSRTNDAPSAYKIQGLWDYSNNRNSGRWSTIQLINIPYTNYDTLFRRHKIRGHGYALQFKVQSSDGLPFDIQGWAVIDTVNTGA